MKKPTDEQYIHAAKRIMREDGGGFISVKAKVKRDVIHGKEGTQKGALVYPEPVWVTEDEAAAVK